MSDSSTHFLARCPRCAAGLRIRRSYEGQSVCCNQCDQIFRAEEVADDTPGPSPVAVASPDRFLVNCPSCRAGLSVRRTYVGKTVVCNQCDESFLVDEPSGPLRAAADIASEALHEEVERLRADRDRAAEEFDRVVEEADRLRASHDEMRGDRDAMAAEIEGLRIDRDRHAAENDRHRADLEPLRLDREALGRSDAEAAELRRQVEELGGERDALHAERDRLAADQDVILEALGGIAPAEVRPMAAERDSLRADADRLAVEVRRFEGEQLASIEQRSGLETSAEGLRRRLEAAQVEADRQAATIRDREAELESISADREALQAGREEIEEEADRLRATIDDLKREHEGLEGRHGVEVAGLRAEVDRLSAVSRERDETVAERDRLQAEAEDQARRHGVEVAGLRAEVDRLSAVSRESEARAGAMAAECDRLATERESARVQVDRLRMSMHQLERDQVDRVERDGAEIDRLMAENQALRVRAERCADSASLPALDEALKTANARILSLEQELENLRRLEREMRGILAGIGIRFRMS